MTDRRSPPLARQSPRELILLVAERLFGEHGMDGVSLRQVSAAAGFSTPVSVQYHFGDRAGLIRAIFEHRLPAIEQRRGQLLRLARQQDVLLDAKALLHIMFEPFLHQKDDRGVHSFAAFLHQAQKSALANEIRATIRMPVTEELANLIWNSAPGLDPMLLRYRLNFLGFSILEQIVQNPHLEDYAGFASHECYYNDIVNAVASALALPPDSEGLAFQTTPGEADGDDRDDARSGNAAGAPGAFLG